MPGTGIEPVPCLWKRRMIPLHQPGGAAKPSRTRRLPISPPGLEPGSRASEARVVSLPPRGRASNRCPLKRIGSAGRCHKKSPESRFRASGRIVHERTPARYPELEFALPPCAVTPACRPFWAALRAVWANRWVRVFMVDLALIASYRAKRRNASTSDRLAGIPLRLQSAPWPIRNIFPPP